MSLGSQIVCAVTSKAIKSGLRECVETDDDALEMSHQRVRVQMPRINLTDDLSKSSAPKPHVAKIN